MANLIRTIFLFLITGTYLLSSYNTTLEEEQYNAIPRIYADYDYAYYEHNSTEKTELFCENISLPANEIIIISCDTTIYDFKLCTVGYDEEHGWNFYCIETFYSLDKLPPDTVIKYATTLPEGVPYEAIVFSDNEGNTYSYLLCYNGRDGSADAIEVSLMSLPN